MFARLFCLVLLVGAVTAESRTLKSTRFSGKNYVSVRDLAAYYGLGRDQARSPDRAQYSTPAGQLTAENEHSDILLNGVTHWLGEPVMAAKNQLWIASEDVLKTIDPVLRQGRSRTKTPIRTIVLDPGHGGSDSGTRGSRSQEKDLTLDLAKRVQRVLEAAGVNVILTRTSDVTFGLPDRVDFAQRKHADLFVSLHFNAGGSADGIETYCVPAVGEASTGDIFRNFLSHASDEVYPGNQNDERNVWLAQCVQKSLLTATGANDRGIRRARFVVIRDAKCPAILVESGFLSNRAEENRILTTEYRDKLAKAIANGILEYKKSVE